jgi:prepilin-type N-terminal cleavage/methylation domain-containing protein
MLQKYKTKREEGFTIIEVLIVLAIAGLIILIVFLAVPALQRNSRNTSRKEDVSRIAGSTQEVLNNNNGQVAALTSAAVQDAVGTTLAYYQSSDISVVAASGTASNGTSKETVEVYTGGKCQTGGQVDNTDTSARQVAIAYTVETGGGEAKVCQDV